MGLFGPYTFKTKEGKIYYLHSVQKGNTKLYFFSRDEAGAEMDLPPNYEAFVSERTGMPMLRKRGGKQPKKGEEEGAPDEGGEEGQIEEQGKS